MRALVVPLREGARAQAERLLAESSPFDPEAVDVERHAVLVSDAEAIFVFGPAPPWATDRILREATEWTAIAPWRDLVASPPRVAAGTYAWARAQRDEGISSASTPGPGDSDGGDVFPP